MAIKNLNFDGILWRLDFDFSYCDGGGYLTENNLRQEFFTELAPGISHRNNRVSPFRREI